MNKALGNKWLIFAFMFPAMLFLTVFYLVPIVETGILGLTQWNGIFPTRKQRRKTVW